MISLTDRQRDYIASLARNAHVSVLFVCLGNICRSPAAEGIFQTIVDEHGQASRYTVDSAGTGNYHIGDLPDHRMRIHARYRGLELTHRCRQVHESDFYDFDLIIPMDADNERNLKRLCPDPADEHKIIPMAAFINKAMRYDYVPDPYYEGAQGFELVLDLLQDGCEQLFNLLSEK